jgi:hypothetical protein
VGKAAQGLGAAGILAIVATLFINSQGAAGEAVCLTHSPRFYGGLKPIAPGQQRLRPTIFPFGFAEFLASQNRRSSPSSAHAPALRVQAGADGLL